MTSLAAEARLLAVAVTFCCSDDARDTPPFFESREVSDFPNGRKTDSDHCERCLDHGPEHLGAYNAKKVICWNTHDGILVDSSYFTVSVEQGRRQRCLPEGMPVSTKIATRTNAAEVALYKVSITTYSGKSTGLHRSEKKTCTDRNLLSQWQLELEHLFNS